MVVFSKCVTIPTTCVEFVHPWSQSCSEAHVGLAIDAVQECLRIYVTVYVLAMLMRGKVPSRKDLRRMVMGILQSVAFLSCAAIGYSMSNCFIRYLSGNYNFLTVSFIPGFVSSFFAILVERPSRRSMLSLYVTNVASETAFRMLAWRGLIKPVKNGEIVIFTVSMSALLYFFRSQDSRKDNIYDPIRFVIGPFEEKDYIENREDLPSMTSRPRIRSNQQSQRVQGSLYKMVSFICRLYNSLLKGIKNLKQHSSCPHPYSCVHYVLQGTAKQFSVGYSLQLCLRLLLQLKRIIRKPSYLPRIFLDRNALRLGAFLGAFSGVFRVVSCTLRWLFNKDDARFAIPAGFLAGLTFKFFPDNTVALYVMWKSLQVIYNDSAKKGIVPELPGAIIFMYCLSTATLFHAAVMEPNNLRPSYWKFLHRLSGGRISGMAREPLDVFGLGTSEALLQVAQRTKTPIRPHFY